MKAGFKIKSEKATANHTAESLPVTLKTKPQVLACPPLCTHREPLPRRTFPLLAHQPSHCSAVTELFPTPGKRPSVCPPWHASSCSNVPSSKELSCSLIQPWLRPHYPCLLITLPHSPAFLRHSLKLFKKKNRLLTLNYNTK